jgi:LysM repeat protein
MNSAKTVVIIGILLGVGYWVYNSMHNKQPSTLPEGVPDDWESGLTIEMPEQPSEGLPYALGSGLQTPPGGLPSVQEPITAQAPPTDGMLSAPLPPNPQVALANEGSASAIEQQPRDPPLFSPPGQTNVEGRQSMPVATPGGDSSMPIADAKGFDSSMPVATRSNEPDASGAKLQTEPQSPPPVDDTVQAVFDEFMAAIQRDLDEQRYTYAHEILSNWYADPRISDEHRRQILDLLDQVAGRVVYSRQPLLGELHVVGPGETLESIAGSYNVPWPLLAKINGIQDPVNLAAGQKLKVIQGPFDAVIDLDKFEMTLMLGRLYAGRFPISVGSDEQQLEGSYEVRSKILSPAYTGAAGEFAGQDPNNPLGDRKLDLGGGVAIHGTNDPARIGTIGGPGSIALSQEGIQHVYDILSVGSRVVIRR